MFRDIAKSSNISWPFSHVAKHCLTSRIISNVYEKLCLIVWPRHKHCWSNIWDFLQKQCLTVRPHHKTLLEFKNTVCFTQAIECLTSNVLRHGQAVKHFFWPANVRYFTNNVWSFAQKCKSEKMRNKLMQLRMSRDADATTPKNFSRKKIKCFFTAITNSESSFLSLCYDLNPKKNNKMHAETFQLKLWANFSEMKRCWADKLQKMLLFESKKMLSVATGRGPKILAWPFIEDNDSLTVLCLQAIENVRSGVFTQWNTKFQVSFIFFVLWLYKTSSLFCLAKGAKCNTGICKVLHRIHPSNLSFLTYLINSFGS